MGLFDIFTGGAHSKNAARTSQMAGNFQQNYSDMYSTAAQDSLGELYNYLQQSTGAVQNYGNQARSDITGYGTAASNALNQGAQYGISELDAILPYLDTYLQSGKSANAMFTDALGLNGKGGNERATGAFQAGPGYQWQVDQATDAAARKASALGIAGSGNTLSAITELGSNLANQEYGGWLDRLSGLNNQGFAATGMLGNIQGQKAGIYDNWGRSQADLYSGMGNSLAGISQNMGNSLAGLYSDYGSNQAGIRSNWADDMFNVGRYSTDLVANAGKDAADAKAAGSGNIWGAATSLFGGLFG